MPRLLSHAGAGASDRSAFIKSLPSDSAYSWTPWMPATKSPTAKPSLFDSITSPTVSARITSPIPTGGTYDGRSFIHPRIAGSTDM